MPFHGDSAFVTLEQTVQALQSAWATLPPPARADVQGAVMTHGLKIAGANSFAAPAAIIQLLDALWATRAALPASAAQALAAGQQPAAPAGGYRSALPSVSEDKRKSLLANLAALADFRLFENPKVTVEMVMRLVAAHDDRLTAEERAAWQKLCAALVAGGDPTEFLRGVEALLGGYPAVKALLVSRKTFVLPAEVIFRGLDVKGLPGRPKSIVAPVAHAMMESAAASAGELVRFANVYFPATIMMTQKDVPLIVHVAQKHSAHSALTEEAATMTLKVGDLTIVIQAEGFAVTEVLGGLPVADGALGRIVKAQAERDCEPVVFLLTPQSVGEKRINIYVEQFGHILLAQPIQVRVVAALDASSNLSNAVAEPTA
ncbi:MAG: hypothetical protein QG637_56, partial [Chloroflexota bacterium]|nr:hypothetical protein [Chloroflexota bacterium]